MWFSWPIEWNWNGTVGSERKALKDTVCGFAITMRRTCPDYPINSRRKSAVQSRANFSWAAQPSPVCISLLLDCKEIQPVRPKDKSWLFIGGTDVEAETPILWPPDAKSWLIWKDPDAGKDWGQERGMTEDEMVEWHHQHDGHGFGWTPGVGDRQEGLAYCGSWGRKESDMTERLNWTEPQKS